VVIESQRRWFCRIGTQLRVAQILIGRRVDARIVRRESQQTALHDSVSQAHAPVAEPTGMHRIASTECMSAEEVLLPRKWKVVLTTLRAMLDRRPEIEDILRVRRHPSDTKYFGIFAKSGESVIGFRAYEQRCSPTLIHASPADGAQANSRTHVPQRLTGLISLSTYPVSISSVPIQTVH
jgi:hypothetical protein